MLRERLRSLAIKVCTLPQTLPHVKPSTILPDTSGTVRKASQTPWQIQPTWYILTRSLKGYSHDHSKHHWRIAISTARDISRWHCSWVYLSARFDTVGRWKSSYNGYWSTRTVGDLLWGQTSRVVWHLLWRFWVTIVINKTVENDLLNWTFRQG